MLSEKDWDNEIRIDFDFDEEVCHKNQYEFKMRDSVYVYNDIVFLCDSVFEAVLNCVLSVENGEIVVKEKEYEQHAWTTEFPALIAHAGGAVREEDHITAYTNSFEALVENYNLGHRVFEIDFLLTSDGKLAAVHDWQQFGYRDGEVLSSEQWKALSISDDKYTTLLADDILDEMMVNKDIFIVTDTKIYAGTGEECAYPIKVLYDEAIKRDPKLAERIIPQIYNEEMYESIMDIYNWPSVIYTVYATGDSSDNIIEFSEHHSNIKVITMPTAEGRFTDSSIERLHSSGKLVYMHTENTYEVFTELRAKGIDGLYTDLLLPADISVYKEATMLTLD